MALLVKLMLVALASSLLNVHAVPNPPQPSTGSPPILTVYIDFSDQKASFNPNDIKNALLTSSNSLPSYFKENSYGKLNYNVAASIVVGSGGQTSKALRMPQTAAYYIANNFGFSGCSGAGGKCIVGAVYDALTTLANTGFNFAPYATRSCVDDASKKCISSLIVVFAGIMSNGQIKTRFLGTATGIVWDHPKAGINIHADVYTWCPERFESSPSGKVAWNGNCIHEHGHAIGMADLIDYAPNAGFGGVGSMDLMATGTFGATNTYSDLAKQPFHLSSLSKILYKWIDPIIVNPSVNVNTVKLKPLEKSGANVIKVQTGTANDYYLIEFRVASGFDTNMKLFLLKDSCSSGGVAVYHVNGDTVNPNSNTFRYNKINTLGCGNLCPSKRGYTIVEADGGHRMTDPGQPTQAYGEGFCSMLLAGEGKSMKLGKLFAGGDSGITVKLKKKCGDGSVLVQITSTAAAKPVRNDSC
jgi:M6 family metalloprotease-like protein